jgi:hypothetical protein
VPDLAATDARLAVLINDAANLKAQLCELNELRERVRKAKIASVRMRRFNLCADYCRGRDASYLAPPAQIRTGPIRAYGSHLGCLTAKRLSGHG